MMRSDFTLLAAIHVGQLFVFIAIGGVSAFLLHLALRRKGLKPPVTCACGYSLEGNESGTCPECGKSTEDARDRRERARLLIAGRRGAFWLFGLAVPLMALSIGVARWIGENVYTDCRAVLAPADPIYQQAELLWKLRGEPGARTASSVTVIITLPSGRDQRETFTHANVSTVSDWVTGLPIKTLPTPSEEPKELGRLVSTALSGAEVVVLDHATRKHTLLAMGSVVTREEPKWLYMGFVLGWSVTLLVTTAWVMRRTMRLSAEDACFPMVNREDRAATLEDQHA